MGFRNPRPGRVAFALNRAVAALALFGDQIDSRIGSRKPRHMLDPLGPEPDLGEPTLVVGILGKKRLHQTFEEAALVSCGISDGPEMIQGFLEADTHPLILSELDGM